MRSRRQTWSTAAVAALAAGIVGCGGSTGPLSAEELIEQGDDLCAEEQKRFREVQAQAPASAADAVDQTRELVSVSEETTEALTEIEPPSNLESAYERYLESRRQALQLLERGRDAAEQHDRVAYSHALEKSIAGEGQRQKLARRIGFKVCGEPQGP